MPDDQLVQLIETDPTAAIKLLQRLKDYVVVPHEGGQKDVIASDARFKVLNCGRRWGKTIIGVKSMLDAAKEKPNQLVWWVAPTYKVVKRGYRHTLKQLPKDFIIGDPPPETNFDAGRSVILKLKNGSTLEFYSAERPGGMLGEGVNFVVLDEAASMPAVVWDQTIRPTLSDTRGRAMMISTPRGRNWFYKRWRMGQDKENSQWASWTFPTESNPHIPSGEIQSAKDELPLRIFEQEYEAKFLAAGSSVFLWDDQHVQFDLPLENGLIEGTKVKGQVFLGVDLAKTTDYTVLYGANEYDLRNVFFERFNSVRWTEQKRRIRRAVSTLLKAGAESVTLVMDATGVGDPIVEDMEEAGYDVIGVNFTGEKNKMVSRFAKDLENGRAYILDELAVEFENYEMNQTEKGTITFGAPSGEHDDVVSAKILQHTGIMVYGSPNVTSLRPSSDPRNPRDEEKKSDEEFEEDDLSGWDDLIDEDYRDPGEQQELVDVALRSLRPPTAEELLASDRDLWN